MVGYVFQINTYPFREEEIMTSDDYIENNLIGSVMSNLYDVNLSDITEEFLEEMKKYATVDKKEKSLIFNEKAKKEYFQKGYAKFKDFINCITFKDFCSDSMKISLLKNIIDYRYGDYVFKDYFLTFDSFMRELTPGIKYYLGGIVGYK